MLSRFMMTDRPAATRYLTPAIKRFTYEYRDALLKGGEPLRSTFAAELIRWVALRRIPAKVVAECMDILKGTHDVNKELSPRTGGTRRMEKKELVEYSDELGAVGKREIEESRKRKRIKTEGQSGSPSERRETRAKRRRGG